MVVEACGGPRSCRVTARTQLFGLEHLESSGSSGELHSSYALSSVLLHANQIRGADGQLQIVASKSVLGYCLGSILRGSQFKPYHTRCADISICAVR